jgi:hypothetical protein
MVDELNISLEPHLAQSLEPIVPLLTDKNIDLRAATIPYSTLLSVSQWARTSAGTKALCSCSLDPGSYSMVALLAGTTTSPERYFGKYIPPPEPHEVQAEKARERKAITTLINGVVSVIGSGFAAYWASDKAAWRSEWVCEFVSIQRY